MKHIKMTEWRLMINLAVVKCTLEQNDGTQSIKDVRYHEIETREIRKVVQHF